MFQISYCVKFYKTNGKSPNNYCVYTVFSYFIFLVFSHIFIESGNRKHTSKIRLLLDTIEYYMDEVFEVFHWDYCQKISSVANNL